MRAASTLIAIGAALCWAATSAHAVGFGRVTSATQLGQPLNFGAAIRLEADESLSRECVFGEVTSGDNKLLPGQVRVTLEGSVDSPDRSVRVTTNAQIDEPVVTVSVTLGCASKVTRRFVVFIDPPLVNLAQAAPAEALPPQRIDSQVAPIVTLVQGEKPARAHARKAPVRPAPIRPQARAPVAPARASEPAPAVAGVPAPKASTTRRAAAASRQPLVARATPSGPRLELEASPLAAALAASSPASLPPVEPVLAAAAPASAAMPDAQAEQLARERQRIQLLEEGLAALRNDSQATQKSLATLHARLKESEAQRYANPLVYALAWLSALLALALAGLWWRQSRARNSAQWWAPPAQASAASRASALEAAGSAPIPLGVTPTAAGAFETSIAIDEDDLPALAPATPITRAAPFSAIALGPEVAERPRELSVEELIDLEQQAEFFIVLGQDEAAIELLMSHVRSDGGISPLPYLKLLEIYRRRGDNDAYERIRDRFNRRFNAYAPDWDSDLQQGRALEGYPDIIARLQGLWASPVRVMETLDASLFRRNRSSDTFDLPAYRELLFLYSIARDLAEHGAALASSDVDLLLPMGDDAAEQPISRLQATTRHGDFQPSDLMTMPLDLDVSFSPAAPSHGAETLPSARQRPPDQRPADSNVIDFNLDPSAKPTKAGPSGNR